MLLMAISVPAQAGENRCGTLINPTPSNWWLNDRDGEWNIAEQGGRAAKNMDRIPDVPDRQWIKTNGSYGYTCACMNVEVDRRAMNITSILSVKLRPLRACRIQRGN